MSYQEAVDTYICGNRSDFKEWLLGATTLDVLNAIEYYARLYGGRRHILINVMRSMLG